MVEWRYRNRDTLHVWLSIKSAKLQSTPHGKHLLYKEFSGIEMSISQHSPLFMETKANYLSHTAHLQALLIVFLRAVLISDQMGTKFYNQLYKSLRNIPCGSWTSPCQVTLKPVWRRSQPWSNPLTVRYTKTRSCLPPMVSSICPL